MTAFKFLSTIVFLIGFSGCATQSVKTQLYRDMTIGLALGFLAGQSKDENKQAYTAMYAGVGAAAAAVISVNSKDPDQETLKLRSQIAKFENELNEAFKPKLEFTSSGMMNSKVPDKYKNMIHPGEWRVYRLDQWVEDGENRLIHQDKMMELVPPSLKPMSMPTNSEVKK